MTARRRLLAPAALALALVAAACEGGGGGGTVEVTLVEYAIAANPSSIPAGEVTFQVTNEGPEDLHELYVFRTDLAPDQLPTNPDGTVDEDAEGIELVGETEEFPPGESRTLTLNLEAGSYVLVCNIYEEEEQEAHYAEGMRASFTVE
jgi:uncharacterized cupredoxin-like copper-binding protein